MYEALIARIRYHIQKANFMGLKEAESTLLLGEAADAIENLKKELDAVVNDAHNEGYDVGYWAGRRDYEPKWIPVTEEPPLKVGDDGYNGYLVYANGYYEVADYTTDKFDNVSYFHVYGEYEPDVTHYMTLPEQPKEET